MNLPASRHRKKCRCCSSHRSLRRSCRNAERERLPRRKRRWSLGNRHSQPCDPACLCSGTRYGGSVTIRSTLLRGNALRMLVQSPWMICLLIGMFAPVLLVFDERGNCRPRGAGGTAAGAGSPLNRRSGRLAGSIAKPRKRRTIASQSSRVNCAFAIERVARDVPATWTISMVKCRNLKTASW